MNSRTDSLEKRKAYAKLRLCSAMKRLLLARNAQEEMYARSWVDAWEALVGDCQFDALLPSGARQRRTRVHPRRINI